MQSDPIIEEWRDVADVDGDYRVSSLGRVMGPRGTILRDRITIWGYTRFAARRGGLVKDVPVHQAVCAAWHGRRPKGHVPNHINGNRLDNRPENLEWVTPQQNISHKVTLGTDPKGERNPRAKLTEADVVRVRALRAEGHSYVAIAAKFGVHKNTIGWAVNGGTWANVCDRRAS